MCMCVCILNYTLCRLLELPHRGDSNGMPQCIVSWIVKKRPVSLILIRFSFLSGPSVSFPYIILAD